MLFPKPTRKIHFLLYGLLYLAGPVLTLQLFAWLDQPYELDDIYRILPTEYVVSSSATPPVSGWRSVDSSQLPVRGEDDPFTSVWYRFNVKPMYRVPVLYFPLPLASLDIWFEQERLLMLGRMTRPLPYFQSPVQVPLPLASDQADARVLDVRIVRHTANTRMPYAYIAPFELVQRDFDDQRLVVDLLPIALLIVMGLFGLVVFFLFLVSPSNSAYGWYSLMILLWGLHTAHPLIDWIPLELPVWFALGYLTLGWIVIELIFVNRFFRIPAPKSERGVMAISSVIAGLLVLAVLLSGFEAMNTVVAFLLTPWTLLCSLLVTSRYFVAVQRDWSYESLSLWLASGIFIGVGIRDILYQYFPPWVSGSNFYLQYVAMLPVTLFGWHLIRRFVEALKVSRMKTNELNATVAVRTAELERSYARLADEEKRRSIEEERSRLMRDMHDGLGGQLVHALALSEQSQDKDLQTALRYALDDLRLVVDSLAPDCNGIQELLAAYRHRVSPSVRRAGVEIHWEIDEQAANLGLDAKDALNVLRILQEAVTNAVRHANCTTIRVTLSNASEGVLFSVADDGDGMSEETGGRGLQNMRVRAREIGAELRVSSSPSGTEVLCLLPVKQ